MSLTTTYTEARANLASFWDRLEEDRDMLIIERRGHESMVMLPWEEISWVMECAHLMRSPANARRLLAALARAERGEGVRMTMAELRAEFEVD